MKYSDKERLKNQMLLMGENWTKDITQNLQDIWWSTLKDYDINIIAEACRITLRERKKEKGYPAPADIIDTIDIFNVKARLQKRLPPPVEPPMTETEMLFFNMNIRFSNKLIKESRSKQWTERERDMFLIENSEGVFNSKTIAECVRLSQAYPDVPKCDPRNEYSGDVSNLIKTIMGKRMMNI